ncbi:MAG: TenA family transcriptional regulator, partial [Oxalobacter sp.]|nr:TenA family transcriptional regulator [Oxalobacter sp.]
MISSDENDYFLRSFKALGITEDARLAPPDSAPTKGLKDIMLEAAKSGSYAAAISVLSVAESVYLDWGLRAPKPHPENFIYTEWITLHNNDYFIGFVNFLQRELDRVGPANADICRDFFMRTVQLEKAFFDDAYA